MSRVPRIRFKGFEEDWEQRKLGECFTERIESMPNGELISVTINDGIKKFSELGRHDNSNDDKSKYKKVCVGDIAYNSMRMWQGASGYSPYDGIVSPAYTVLAANHGVYSRCIAYQFKLSKMIHTFKINSQGITSDNWNLKFPALSDIPIYISNQIDEQCKIAFFLETLDHLITLHQRKLEKLKIVKKSMLENLFPQNGEKTPKIRFSGFTKDWEQRKLGEIFIYLRNNTLSREELNDEDGFAQSIHYGDVLIKYGECLNVSKELLPYIGNKNIVNKFKKFYIQNGDVIIADTAEDETVGKCIEISGIVDHNIISGLHTIPLRPVNKFAYGYLGFYLNSNSYHNQLKPLMQGIKVTSISKNLLKITTLNYTSNIQEQKIIGRYFEALNHLITLHQSKLEKLQKIKKSMLESMFV